MTQVFREPAVDTKVVVAVGPDTILLSFRGTASWANVVKDLQARSPCMPMEGCCCTTVSSEQNPLGADESVRTTVLRSFSS